jgi:hypothetical protein
MIPEEINRQHILEAIQMIDTQGVPDEYQSKKYDLLFEGNRYPPKYVISLSNLFANGMIHPVSEFSGGSETNNFLALNNFIIVGKNSDILPLTLYQDYSRENVQKIFAPDAKFSRGAGTWGILGIVPIRNRSGDFVFFVTFGQQQGEHLFDEGITEDGVLSWQSQPKQTLNSPQIQQIINHDELVNCIYLFLRTKEKVDYTYLGKLKYLSHDAEREKPVYFQFQIIDGSIPDEVSERINLITQPTTDDIKRESPPTKINQLKVVPPPVSITRKGINTPTFRARKVKDYSLIDAKNKALGNSGESLVLEYEREQLIKSGLTDLAEKIRHTSEIEGDGAGYDIQSFYENGSIKFIEVKTTKGGAETAFYMSSNEVEFAKQNVESYYIYRVYDYDSESNTGKFYIINGEIEQLLDLTPTTYRANYLPK